MHKRAPFTRGFAENSIIQMRDNVSFVNSIASADFGGALCSSRCAIMMNSNTFSDNCASKFFGRVLWSFNSSTIIIEASEFHHNTAGGGSVLASLNSFVTIEVNLIATRHCCTHSNVIAELLTNQIQDLTAVDRAYEYFCPKAWKAL